MLFVCERHESAMEEEIQTKGSKFPRIGNGNYRTASTKIGQKGDDKYLDDEGEIKRLRGGGANNTINIASGGGVNRLCGWPSSRIVRVSRASGGKDRHSKVLTSKGLRDRRVRLSVDTAIQFYDLQDRLGYDQPSKAVEWLLNAAAPSIDQLPPISNSFPATPKQVSDEKTSSTGTEHGFDSAEVDPNGDPNLQQHQRQQYVSLSKSTCSSTSETSKGSGLSLSRSENRFKARERARERTAEKEKEKGNEYQVAQHPQSVSPITQNSSFTELLTGGINNVHDISTSPSGPVHQKLGGVEAEASAAAAESIFFQKSPRQWAAPTPVDYFTTGLLGPACSSRSQQHSSSGFSGQIHMGNSFSQSMMVSPFHVAAGASQHYQEMQQQNYATVPGHLVPVVTSNSSHDYNVNFTISSSSLAGFNNRGTLQSNSPSLLPQLQRFSSIEGSGFFIGTAATQNTNAAAAQPVENHHHHHPFSPAFDAHLQLFYGDIDPSDQKGKGKN